MKKKKMALAIACMAILAVGTTVFVGCNNGKTADCTIDRKEHLTNEEWEIITINCEYFSKLLEAEEYLKSGGKLSAGMVQPLLPTNEKDFDLFSHSRIISRR